jgi:hypothetical protein
MIYHLYYNFQLKLHPLGITPSRCYLPQHFPGNQQKNNNFL